MKKLLAILLSMTIIFAITGCGNKNDEKTDEKEPIKEEQQLKEDGTEDENKEETKEEKKEETNKTSTSDKSSNTQIKQPPNEETAPAVKNEKPVVSQDDNKKEELPEKKPDDSANTKKFIEKLKSSANLRWNICTTAEEMITGNVGNKVFFLMCNRSLEEEGSNKSESDGNQLLKEFVKNASSFDTAEEIANAVIKSPVLPFQPMVMPVEPGLLNGFDNNEITGFKDGVMFAPMIGSIPFLGYIFIL